MIVQHFFDPDTYTLSYLVYDRDTHDAVVVDPVLNYDHASSTTSTRSLQALLTFIEANDLQLKMTLETHAHADHLSSAQLIKKQLKTPVAIGEGIRIVQKTFKKVFDFQEFQPDGSQFDRLLKDGETVAAGSLSFRVLSTPGHTPACCTFLFDGFAFVGDALFMPDYGCGRCDFPGGDATALFKSISERLYTLPDDTKLLTGHDYLPGGRDLRYEATVKEQKETNVQIPASISSKEFIKFRSERDATLSAPALIYPSIQFNILGSDLTPLKDEDGLFLKTPLHGPTH